MAHRPRAPVVLTSFHKQGSLDTYLHEVRSIRESRMLYPARESRDDEQAGDEEGTFTPIVFMLAGWVAAARGHGRTGGLM